MQEHVEEKEMKKKIFPRHWRNLPSVILLGTE